NQYDNFYKPLKSSSSAKNKKIKKIFLEIPYCKSLPNERYPVSMQPSDLFRVFRGQKVTELSSAPGPEKIS
ncbi:MAG: hypothetical protein LUQ52_04905, partial [Methylococcaceae bacterium]|nr:hypothetical protein [Methylococcaceae bacterium]